jgi:putative chitinase
MTLSDAGLALIKQVPASYGITTPRRQAHCLAQLAHESGGFRRMVENLNYSADGLCRTWPSRFDHTTAPSYARKPERIANKVYANRLGNGPESSGDGWRFRGRGFIQITGRANYADYSKRVFGDYRLVDTPDLAADPKVAVQIAAEYWTAKGLNALADADDIEGITRRINGGLNGIADRKRRLAHYKQVLGA